MSRGGAGREGSSPWGLGVAGGEVFQTSSRGRAGQRRQGTNLEEQGTSRTGGRRSRTSGGRLGDEQQSRGREWRTGGAGEEIGGAGRSPRSLLFSRASVSWPRARLDARDLAALADLAREIWRGRACLSDLAALALAPAYAPTPRRPTRLRAAQRRLRAA
jgi:hypothetical protein